MERQSARGKTVRFKDSLAYHLLRVVFALYFVFAIGITAYHMRLDYNTARNQIVERLGLVEKAFEDSLATALFDLDRAQLQSILSGLNEMQAVVGVQLQATSSDVFVPDAAIGLSHGDDPSIIVRWDPSGTASKVEISPDRLIVHEFVLNQPGTNTEIAKGKLYSSSGVVFATVQNSFLRLVISAIAKTGLLWLLFLWASTGRLTRPLRKFAEDVSQIDPDREATKPIHLERRKQRDDELQLLSCAIDRMQSRIGDHIAALRSEKIAAEEAKKEAEEANMAKSKFLSSMSHELRTPLNAIMGFSQIMEFDEDSPLDEAQQENLAEITRASHHLLSLIDGVLDLATIEHNPLVVAKDIVTTGEVIAESLQLVLPMTKERGIHIEINVDGRTASIKELLADPRTIQGDQVRLRQVILNLLTNAVKYNRPNGRVEVGCRSTKETTLICITDTGQGLTPEEIDQLFIPFNRLGKEGSTIEGTGIGLVITKNLIEGMDGTIGVNSCPGKGSTFWIELPNAEPRQANDVPRPSEALPPLTALGDVDEDHTILYIEDNPTNIQVVKRTLDTLPSLQFLAAEEPRQGLDLASRHDPDVILLDINLPEMNGFEVLDHLRHSDRTRHIPVIGISANALPEDIDRAQDAGFDDYLTKPLNIQALKQSILSAL